MLKILAALDSTFEWTAVRLGVLVQIAQARE